MDRPLWQPSPERIARANLTAFARHVRRQWDADVGEYPRLYQWSVDEPEQFWQSVWSFCKVIGDEGTGPVLIDGAKMPGARWFPQARLNFAENLLRRRDRATALVFWGENRVKSRVTYGELHAESTQPIRVVRIEDLTAVITDPGGLGEDGRLTSRDVGWADASGTMTFRRRPECP